MDNLAGFGRDYSYFSFLTAVRGYEFLESTFNSRAGELGYLPVELDSDLKQTEYQSLRQLALLLEDKVGRIADKEGVRNPGTKFFLFIFLIISFKK